MAARRYRIDELLSPEEIQAIENMFAYQGQAAPEGGFTAAVKHTAGQWLEGLGRGIEDYFGEGPVSRSLRASGEKIQEENKLAPELFSWLGLRQLGGQMLPPMSAALGGAIAGGAFGGLPGAVVGGLLGGIGAYQPISYGNIKEFQEKEGYSNPDAALAGSIISAGVEGVFGAQYKAVSYAIKSLLDKMPKEVAESALAKLYAAAPRKTGEGVLKYASKELTKLGGIGAAEEVAQEVIERAFGGAPLLDEEALKSYGYGAAGGFLGEMLGGAPFIRIPAQAEAPISEQPQSSSAQEVLKKIPIKDTGWPSQPQFIGPRTEEEFSRQKEYERIGEEIEKLQHSLQVQQIQPILNVEAAPQGTLFEVPFEKARELAAVAANEIAESKELTKQQTKVLEEQLVNRYRADPFGYADYLNTLVTEAKAAQAPVAETLTSILQPFRQLDLPLYDYVQPRIMPVDLHSGFMQPEIRGIQTAYKIAEQLKAEKQPAQPVQPKQPTQPVQATQTGFITKDDIKAMYGKLIPSWQKVLSHVNNIAESTKTVEEARDTYESYSGSINVAKLLDLAFGRKFQNQYKPAIVEQEAAAQPVAQPVQPAAQSVVQPVQPAAQPGAQPAARRLELPIVQPVQKQRGRDKKYMVSIEQPTIKNEKVVFAKVELEGEVAANKLKEKINSLNELLSCLG